MVLQLARCYLRPDDPHPWLVSLHHWMHHEKVVNDGASYDYIPLRLWWIRRHPSENAKSIFPNDESSFHGIVKGCVAVDEHLLFAISANPPLITKMIVCAAVRGQISMLISVPRIYQIIFTCNWKYKIVIMNHKKKNSVDHKANKHLHLPIGGFRNAKAGSLCASCKTRVSWTEPSHPATI